MTILNSGRVRTIAWITALLALMAAAVRLRRRRGRCAAARRRRSATSRYAGEVDALQLADALG